MHKYNNIPVLNGLSDYSGYNLLCATLLLLLLICNPAASEDLDSTENSPPRMALIHETMNGAEEAVLQLSEVKLSKNSKFQLLDRTTVNTILTEQNLSANGVVFANDAIQFGQLLKVDLFVYVQPVPDSQALSVKAFETAHGIRLLDEVLLITDVESAVPQLVNIIQDAAQKQQDPTEGSATLALMSIRNVNLPDDYGTFCQATGMILERRLLRSPSITIAERSQLQHLLRENTLTMSRTSSALRSAPVLIDLDISQKDNGILFALAHLSDLTGKNITPVSAQGRSALELADNLSAAIIETLNITPIPPINTTQEAKCFFQTSRFWKAQKQPQKALSSAEAAYALDPDNPAMCILLCNTLFFVANETLKENRPYALQCAARGMNLLQQEYFKTAETAPKKHLPTLEADTSQFFRDFGNHLDGLKQETPFSDTEAQAYSEFCRDWLSTSAFSPNRDNAAKGWDLLLLANGSYMHYFDNPAEAWEVLSAQVKKWSIEQIYKDPDHIPPSMLDCIIASRNIYPPFESEIYRIRADLWSYLKTNDNALLQVNGNAGQAIDTLKSTGNDTEILRFFDDSHEKLTGIIPLKCIRVEDLIQITKTALNQYYSASETNEEYSRRQRRQCSLMITILEAGLNNGNIPHGILTEINNALLDMTMRKKENQLKETLNRLHAIIHMATTDSANKLSLHDIQTLKTFRDKIDSEAGFLSKEATPAYNLVRLKLEPNVPLEVLSFFRNESGAYFVSFSRKLQKLFFYKWNDALQAPSNLCSVDIQNIIKTDGLADYNDIKVSHICYDGSRFSMILNGFGVILLNPVTGRINNLLATTSLPVKNAMCSALLNDILYIATRDGRLLSYDCKSGNHSAVIASSRKDRHSPFDDGPPAKIYAMFSDTKRQRLVFVVSVVDAESQLGRSVKKLCGIWEFIPKTNTFKQLVPFRHRLDDVQWCKMINNESFALRNIKGVILQYNIFTDTLTVLSGGNMLTIFEKELIQWMEANHNTRNQPLIDKQECPGKSPFATSEGWLWTADPWGRLSLTDYQWQKLPPIEISDNYKKQKLIPWLGIFPISAKKMLLITRENIWAINPLP